MVPATPTSATICQYPAGRPVITEISNVAALVTALDTLPTSEIQAGCTARFPGALPAKGTFEVHFHYATGPDVAVNVLPECKPSINNQTSLQADDATTVLPLLSAATANSAVLKLSVGLYGGPLNPSTGREADTGTPIPHTTITVMVVGGTAFSVTTDSTGIATVHLKPGTYSVTTRQCGPGATPHPLTLIGGEVTSYNVVCSIP
jgi:hypothetical protein